MQKKPDSSRGDTFSRPIDGKIVFRLGSSVSFFLQPYPLPAQLAPPTGLHRFAHSFEAYTPLHIYSGSSRVGGVQSAPERSSTRGVRPRPPKVFADFPELWFLKTVKSLHWLRYVLPGELSVPNFTSSSRCFGYDTPFLENFRSQNFASSIV